jgi:hypothetical protein
MVALLIMDCLDGALLSHIHLLDEEYTIVDAQTAIE